MAAMTAVDFTGFPDAIAEKWRPRPRLRGPRYLVDPESQMRLVVEERPAYGVAGARRASYLIVFFEQGFHRVWQFPENWDELAGAELLRLVWLPRRRRADG